MKTKVEFTADEKTTIRRAAQKVWNDIAYDCLQAYASGTGAGARMRRSHVVEVVCDANRLEEELRRQKVPVDLTVRVMTAGIDIYRVVRGAFPDSWYGL